MSTWPGHGTQVCVQATTSLGEAGKVLFRRDSHLNQGTPSQTGRPPAVEGLRRKDRGPQGRAGSALRCLRTRRMWHPRAHQPAPSDRSFAAGARACSSNPRVYVSGSGSTQCAHLQDVCARTSTRTHAHRHTRTCTHTQTHTHRRTRARTCTCTLRAQMHTDTWTHMHAHAHRCTRARIHTHTRIFDPLFGSMLHH